MFAKHIDINKTVVICGALILALFAFHVSSLWGRWSIDFSAYYYAGHFWGTGQLDQIYAGPPQIIGSQTSPEWISALIADGHEGQKAYPFIYPPWVAAVTSPIAMAFDPMPLMNAMLIINCVLMIASMGLAYRLMQPHDISPELWTFLSVMLLAFSFPSTTALLLGQIQVLVFFLCLLAFERYRSGAFWIAGMALALAACIKIIPGVLILIFLWDRNWRALAGFTLISGLILAASFLFIGVPLHAEFLDILHRLDGQLFVTVIGLSVEGFLFDLVHIMNGTGIVHDDYEMIFDKPQWVALSGKALFVFGAAAIWWFSRRMAPARRLQRQFFGLALLIPLAMPLGWAHYFLLLTYVMPGFGVLFGKRAFAVFLPVYLLIFSLLAQSISAQLYLTFFPQIMYSVPILLCMLGVAIFAPAPSKLPVTGRADMGNFNLKPAQL